MDKRYVFVYGAGISGCGVAEVLANRGEKVFLYNDSFHEIDKSLVYTLIKNGGSYLCDQDPEQYLDKSYQMIVSPGISIDCELAHRAQSKGIEVIGEVEAACRIYKGRWVGITGTNGKTTTTTIVGEMLKTLPIPVAVGGNIGFALSKEVDRLPKDSWIVAELSSFQLEGVTSFKPNIALVLNITPDHLARHGGMAGYIAAKARIFAKQNSEDILIVNNDDALVRAFATQTQSTICYISRKHVLGQGVYIDEGKFFISWHGERYEVCAVKDMQLFGSHNEENALGAIACAFFAGVSIENIASVLTSFRGVEHRLEYVAEIAGVPYYNDSKATNPDSTIKALEAFGDGHIILLAGGRDKLTDLTQMMEVIKKQTDALILLGEAKDRFKEAAEKAGVENIYCVSTFAEGVQKAYGLAHESQVVLLSPACASYDMFENFPQRGKVFKKLVHKLANDPEEEVL